MDLDGPLCSDPSRFSMEWRTGTSYGTSNELVVGTGSEVVHTTHQIELAPSQTEDNFVRIIPLHWIGTNYISGNRQNSKTLLSFPLQPHRWVVSTTT